MRMFWQKTFCIRTGILTQNFNTIIYCNIYYSVIYKLLILINTLSVIKLISEHDTPKPVVVVCIVPRQYWSQSAIISVFNYPAYDCSTVANIGTTSSLNLLIRTHFNNLK